LRDKRESAPVARVVTCNHEAFMMGTITGEQKRVTSRFFVGDWFARWSRLSVEFGLSQALGQSTALISGLIYVRLMPVDQYAVYAISLTSLAFISTGSDLGLTSSVNYFWREGSRDQCSIEPIIAAVQRLRWALLVLASFVSGALLLKAIREQNLPIISVFACFGLVVGTVSARLRATLDIQLMRLEGMQRESYYCEAAGSITRLLVAVAMIVTGITTALFGLAGGLLGSLAMWATVRGFAGTPRSKLHSVESETWRKLLGYVIPTGFTTLVYMVQLPIVLWLALTFGGKALLAETFAVGRIGAIYGLMSVFVGAVIGPRLARISDDARFVRTAGLFLLALVLLSVGAIMMAYLAPTALLLLIGPKYAHLDREVALTIAAASFDLLTAFLAMVNRLRGWVRLESLTAACQAVIIFMLASHWSFHDTASAWSLIVILSGFSFLWTGITYIVGLSAPAVVKVR
jgi:O-antigen/teichoic acid export membrane protein